MDSYRELEVWKRSMSLVNEIYRLTRAFPDFERYSMTNQLQRAAVSIPSNIAEGWSQGHTKAYLRHLSIARGSLAELETLVTLAHQLGYISQDALKIVESFTKELGCMTNALQKSLRRCLATGSSSSKFQNPNS
ncbi:MAG: four helix bundle protein [Phycisphaeraceae bacterium]|nr:four helix bundle protein [Phycisphaeraceae bacterium]